MTIAISDTHRRSTRALEMAADAGPWLKCRCAGGRTACGVPSQSRPGHFYLADCHSCTCPDAQPFPDLACKHMLAVRLRVELLRAQQRSEVPTAA